MRKLLASQPQREEEVLLAAFEARGTMRVTTATTNAAPSLLLSRSHTPPTAKA